MKIREILQLNQKGFSHVELGLLVVVVLAVAVIGVRVLGGSHAESINAPLTANTSSPGYKTLNGPNGSTMDIYTSDNSSQLYAVSEMVPSSSGLVLTSDTTKLKQCADTTGNYCSAVESSSSIINYTGGNGIPNDYYVETAGYPNINGSDVYEACTTFKAGSWSGTNKCDEYAMYSYIDWTNIPSSYATTSITPSFDGCMISKNSTSATFKVMANRNTSAVVSDAIVWGPNLQSQSPSGNITNNHWMVTQPSTGGGSAITKVTVPLSDQYGISYQTSSAGYGYNTPQKPPTTLTACN